MTCVTFMARFYFRVFFALRKQFLSNSYWTEPKNKAFYSGYPKVEMIFDFYQRFELGGVQS